MGWGGQSQANFLLHCLHFEWVPFLWSLEQKLTRLSLFALGILGVSWDRMQDSPDQGKT